VDGTSASRLTSAEKAQNQASGLAHEEEKRPGDCQEAFHGRGYSQCDLLGALQGQSLGHEFTQQNVQVGDQTESDHHGDAVGVYGCVRDLVDKLQPFYETRDHGLANPAQSQANHGNAELDAIYYFVEMLVKALHDASAGAAGGNELLNASIANADQGKFSRRKKRIRCHQKKDQ
jgi:hypothetical protein